MPGVKVTYKVTYKVAYEVAYKVTYEVAYKVTYRSPTRSPSGQRLCLPPKPQCEHSDRHRYSDTNDGS
jgi:hypothetical protein